MQNLVLKDSKPLIGILMLNTVFRRILGDIGNPNTFNFPVRYKIVTEFFPPKRVLNLHSDPSAILYFIKAAKELELEGIKAITTSCGFLSLFQGKIRKELNIPIFTSSLLQVPMLSRMINPNEYVGIITANSKSLTKQHLRSVGISNEFNIDIAGMEESYYFVKIIIDQSMAMSDINIENIKKEMLDIAKSFIKKNPRIKVIVFECTNMPPFAKAVQDEINLPIFDIVTLTNMVEDALSKELKECFFERNRRYYHMSL